MNDRRRDWFADIERAFAGRAFARPLFYAYPGGLRFELSEGGAPLTQVLVALRKAERICDDVFAGDAPVLACVQWYAPDLARLREASCALRSAGVTIPNQRSITRRRVCDDDMDGEADDVCWWACAFEARRAALPNLLWCALVQDFPEVQPNPRCTIHLFDLTRKIIVLPYDDRGMDVVGEDRALLASLYEKHNAWLLDYDRPVMTGTFGALE